MVYDITTRKPWDYTWSFDVTYTSGITRWYGYHVVTCKEEELTYELAMLTREYNRLLTEVKEIEDERGDHQHT